MSGPPLVWDPGPSPASPKPAPVLPELWTFILEGSWVIAEEGQGRMGKKGDKGGVWGCMKRRKSEICGEPREHGKWGEQAG